MLFGFAYDINRRTGENNMKLFFLKFFIFSQRNNQQANASSSTVDDLKENNSLQQLTPGLITFLNIRTPLMKLYCRKSF